MSLCSCCLARIAAPVIPTIAGSFEPTLGLCRACWHCVGRSLRKLLRAARLAFRLQPFLAQAIALYWLWEIALTQARAGMRRAA